MTNFPAVQTVIDAGTFGPLDEVVSEVKTRGARVEMKVNSSTGLPIAEIYLSDDEQRPVAPVTVEVEQAHINSSVWRVTLVDELQLVVYPRRDTPHRYKVRRDRTYNTARAAECVMNALQAEKLARDAETERKNRVAQVAPLVAELKEQFGLPSHSQLVSEWVDGSHRLVARPGSVMLRVNMQVSVETARRVLGILSEQGELS